VGHHRGVTQRVAAGSRTAPICRTSCEPMSLSNRRETERPRDHKHRARPAEPRLSWCLNGRAGRTACSSRATRFRIGFSVACPSPKPCPARLMDVRACLGARDAGDWYEARSQRCPVLRQNLIRLVGRRPMLSRQAKERLGDCRPEGDQQCGSVGPPPQDAGPFGGWGGEQPDGRTGPIVANPLELDQAARRT
jgi:hypothetical protein